MLDIQSCVYRYFVGTSLRSEVTSVDHPDLTFVLSLIRTTPTFDQSEQSWELITDMAVSVITYCKSVYLYISILNKKRKVTCICCVYMFSRN